MTGAWVNPHAAGTRRYRGGRPVVKLMRHALLRSWYEDGDGFSIELGRQIAVKGIQRRKRNAWPIQNKVYTAVFLYPFYFTDDREAMGTSVFVDAKSEQSVHRSEKIETDDQIPLFVN